MNILSAMSTRLLDPQAVQAQMRRLGRTALPGSPIVPWLHAEIARRMAERLAIIRLQPRRIIEWSGALGGGGPLLRSAYPAAARWIIEPQAALVELSRRAERAAWWTARRWTRPAVQVLGEGEPLPSEIELLWANMVLHAVADPPALIARWHEALAVDGFVMFSCFGPDTLAEIRASYRRAGWPTPGVDFVDMHDLGDMLVHAGFADPVMDQEQLTLTWPTPEALIAELRGLGGNVSPARCQGLRTPRWKGRLMQALDGLRGADGRLALRFEVVYGHAFKAPPKVRPQQDTKVSLDAMRAMVRRRRAPG